MKRTTSIACFTSLFAAVVTVALTGSSAPVASTASTGSHGVVFSPAAASWQMVRVDEPPPTAQDCYDVGFRCFAPSAMAKAYNYAVLHAAGNAGQGVTIAIIISFGSDTIAHDLHVFNQAFGLQPMCGEEGVTCAAGMPSFSQLAVQGSPPTNEQPGGGPHQEDHTIWALEVSLDVEMAHAIAPMANILLVTTPTAETLGNQGFPAMMNAEQFVVDNHLASVISQSFGSAEDAFSSTEALQNRRNAFESAAANGVTVLASSGDGGTANGSKEPVGQGGQTFPFPTVEWPASDPLVTAVGGTYLCTDPANTSTR